MSMISWRAEEVAYILQAVFSVPTCCSCSSFFSCAALLASPTSYNCPRFFFTPSHLPFVSQSTIPQRYYITGFKWDLWFAEYPYRTKQANKKAHNQILKTNVLMAYLPHHHISGHCLYSCFFPESQNLKHQRLDHHQTKVKFSFFY